MPTECPVCGEHTARRAFVKGGYELYRCEACDLLFVHPFPTVEAVQAHYHDSYRGVTAAFYPKVGSRRRRAFSRSLRLIRYLRGRRALDVGCGGGFMVEAFARIGADAAGLDISANSIAFARQRFPELTFFNEGLTEFARRGLSFDFVFAAEVLEHLAGPAEFMDLLEASVVPGGYVYLSTPDVGHPAAPTNLLDWPEICPPEHLQFFNADNLDLLFARHGFALHRRIRRSKPSHSVIYRRRLAPAPNQASTAP